MTLSEKTVSCDDVYSLLNLYGFDFDLCPRSGVTAFIFTQC